MVHWLVEADDLNELGIGQALLLKPLDLLRQLCILCLGSFNVLLQALVFLHHDLILLPDLIVLRVKFLEEGLGLLKLGILLLNRLLHVQDPF